MHSATYSSGFEPTPDRVVPQDEHYGYDGLSRRITGNSLGGDEIFYNDQWKPVETRFWDEFGPDPLYCQYLWGARHRDDLILRRRDSNVGGELDETIWVTHDYFSPATLLKEVDDPYHPASAVLRLGFSPFGEMRYIGPADITSLSLSDALEEYDWSYGFQGQFMDRWTGLYNYGYRDYSPWLGRWLSRDPIGEKGGINLYAYAGNNPVNLVDYLGLDAVAPVPTLPPKPPSPWPSPTSTAVCKSATDVGKVRITGCELKHSYAFPPAIDEVADEVYSYIGRQTGIPGGATVVKFIGNSI